MHDGAAPPAEHNFIRYRPDLDGLRAVAVLCVVIYHAFPHVLRGGFIGVDVFFVISGYLISGQIFGEIRSGRFSLARFYGRRIRRIFPALAVVLLATLAYGFVVLLPTELAGLGADVTGGAGFVSNLMLWSEAGYFDRASLLKPLLHLWSLGVEEQFYIVWPITLLAAYRVGLLRPGALAVLALASLGASVALAGPHPTADFYAPFTRFWELSAGALLAWRQSRPGAPIASAGRTQDAMSVSGLLLILCSTVALDAEMPFPGWLALAPVLGAVLLIGAGPAAWANRQVLSLRAAIFIGVISYPLYLWHWPLISYAALINDARQPRTLPALAIIAAAILLASATTWWVERPLRFGGAKRAKAVFLLAAIGGIGGFGAATWASGGYPARFPPLPDVAVNRINLAVRDGIFRAPPRMRVRMVDGITVGELGDAGSAIMFTGDSALFQWAARVDELLGEGRLLHRVYFVSGPSCRPIPAASHDPKFAFCANLARVQAQVIEANDIRAIVVGALWQFGGGPEAATTLYASLEGELAGWARQGHAVYVILPLPAGPDFDPAQMVRHRLTGVDVRVASLEGVPVTQLMTDRAPVVRQLAALAQRAGASTLDPLPDICGEGPVCLPLFGNGDPKFADQNHLRPVFIRSNIRFLDGLLTR